MRAAISAWAVVGRSRVPGQKSAAEEEKLHGGIVGAAKRRELLAWKKFKVFTPLMKSTSSKSVVDARRAAAWKMVYGGEDMEARLAAKRREDPDLKDGPAKTAAFDPLTLRSYLWVLSKNGIFGRWASRTPFGKRMAFSWLTASRYCGVGSEGRSSSVET